MYEQPGQAGSGLGGEATLLQLLPGGAGLMTATGDCRFVFLEPRVRNGRTLNPKLGRGLSCGVYGVLWGAAALPLEWRPACPPLLQGFHSCVGLDAGSGFRLRV